ITTPMLMMSYLKGQQQEATHTTTEIKTPGYLILLATHHQAHQQSALQMAPGIWRLLTQMAWGHIQGVHLVEDIM
ncbi:hypothetical protein, partial [Klebsiella pneumoniae]|uniref:hypothetical protein n=1 Tax=Klebsiella pneumoniae TaxID=573 RepID=UPI0019548D74